MNPSTSRHGYGIIDDEEQQTEMKSFSSDFDC